MWVLYGYCCSSRTIARAISRAIQERFQSRGALPFTHHGRSIMASPLRSPATRARQSAHDDEISRAMDKAVKTRTETYEQFASRLPHRRPPRTRHLSRAEGRPERHRARQRGPRVAQRAGLTGPAQDGRGVRSGAGSVQGFREELRGVCARIRRRRRSDRSHTNRVRARRQRRRREREDGGRLQGGGHEG